MSAGPLSVADHQGGAEPGDVEHADQEVADVGQHQQALGVARLAAQHHQRAEALRVAERDPGQVEHDAGGRIGEDLVDDAGQLAAVSMSISPARRRTASSAVAVPRWTARHASPGQPIAISPTGPVVIGPPAATSVLGGLPPPTGSRSPPGDPGGRSGVDAHGSAR